MIKNSLKIAIRILWKNKLFSLVNILSLSLSMAVGVILFTFIKANHDTDHFHPQLNQIVRILTQETNEVEQTKWATAPLPLATQMESVSFVEKTVKVRLAGKHNLQTDRGDVPIDIKFSEPSFFDVFGFKLLSGNAQSLTNNPTTIFLTEKTAKKIFGNTNALGQTVQFEKLGSYTVEGIIQDPPLETHLPIEAMGSINSAGMLGSEIRKTRPAIIVNNNIVGRLPLKTIVPLTDWKVRYAVAAWMVKIMPDQENNLSKDSAADCFQIRSVAGERLIKQIGSINFNMIEKIRDAIILMLNPI